MIKRMNKRIALLLVHLVLLCGLVLIPLLDVKHLWLLFAQHQLVVGLIDDCYFLGALTLTIHMKNQILAFLSFLVDLL